VVLQPLAVDCCTCRASHLAKACWLGAPDALAIVALSARPWGPASSALAGMHARLAMLAQTFWIYKLTRRIALGGGPWLQLSLAVHAMPLTDVTDPHGVLPCSVGHWHGGCLYPSFIKCVMLMLAGNKVCSCCLMGCS